MTNLEALREGLRDIDAFVETTIMEIQATGAADLNMPDLVARILGQQHVLALGLLHVLDELEQRP